MCLAGEYERVCDESHTKSHTAKYRQSGMEDRARERKCGGDGDHPGDYNPIAENIERGEGKFKVISRESHF